ncbi:Gfo/Idh/MocA family protein [Lederbergia graminis]|uniref:Gfo/Idh/MocA family protein n=1 Tax=Lederbergia graminis TaxID=735518 RepID=A0ABW0LHA5_9BACI
MKVAVIGSGKLGQRHLNTWSQMDGVEIVGVIARNQVKLQEVAAKYETTPYESLQDLIAKTDVDIIDICTPTYSHGEFIKEAAQAQKHIICEKPLAINSEEAEKLISICEDNGVQLLVGHTLRFFPEYANARNQIHNGAIGTPGVIRMSRGVPYPQVNSWYTDDSKSGGLFLDLGVHEFDWLIWTFGDVKRVMAKRVQREDMEYGLITVRMEDGTIAHIELSWAETQFRASYELAGDKGMITYNYDDSTPIAFQSRHNREYQLPRTALKKDPYYRQLEHFIQILSNQTEPIVTAHDALKAIQLAEAARKSAETGQPVSFLEGVK